MSMLFVCTALTPGVIGCYAFLALTFAAVGVGMVDRLRAERERDGALAALEERSYG